MISAIVLAERTATAGGEPACLAAFGTQTMLEEVVHRVLRGPFGVTFVVCAPEHLKRLEEVLHGFAVQFYAVPHLASGPHAALSAALQQVETFRERWKKSRAAAQARFTAPQSHLAPRPSGRRRSKSPSTPPPPPTEDSGTHWPELLKSPDVKIRGLARSFERDGVIVFQAGQVPLDLEAQAQLVEAFGRDMQAGPAAHAFVQAVREGVHGYPLIMSVEAAAEVARLSLATDFEAWLEQRRERVLEVSIQNTPPQSSPPV